MRCPLERKQVLPTHAPPFSIVPMNGYKQQQLEGGCDEEG